MSATIIGIRDICEKKVIHFVLLEFTFRVGREIDNNLIK
jgi:hypothetical protein